MKHWYECMQTFRFLSRLSIAYTFCLNKMNVTTEDKKEGILRWSRDAPPAHYSFKIKSFSQLSKYPNMKYESNVFESGGYKWKMLLYPNGDENKTGKDHISLYLVMVETNSLHSGWEVQVFSRLFVYDQIRDKYVTFEDIGGLKRFHAMKTEWGFSKFIPLSTFNDSANGYLVDDTCVFGVDVFVYKNSGMGECFLLLDDPFTIKHTWKIEKFSQLEKSCCYSEMFTVGEQKWHIKFLPKGQGDQRNKYISMYLCFADKASLPSGYKVYLEYELRVKDQKFDGEYTEATKDVDWFSASAPGWGYKAFMDLCDLRDPTKGYLVNDTCIVEAELKVLGTINELS